MRLNLALLALSLIGCRAAAPRSAPPSGNRLVAVGDQLPVITLEGGKRSTEALRGHPAVIQVTAFACSLCNQQLPLLRDLYARHRLNGLQVVSIALDDAGAEERVLSVARTAGIVFPIWRDPEKVTPGLLGFDGTPQVYVIDADQKVLWVEPGVARTDTPSWIAFVDSLMLAIPAKGRAP
jgi:peroxiredoxin